MTIPSVPSESTFLLKKKKSCVSPPPPPLLALYTDPRCYNFLDVRNTTLFVWKIFYYCLLWLPNARKKNTYVVIKRSLKSCAHFKENSLVLTLWKNDQKFLTTALNLQLRRCSGNGTGNEFLPLSSSPCQSLTDDLFALIIVRCIASCLQKRRCSSLPFCTS